MRSSLGYCAAVTSERGKRELNRRARDQAPEVKSASRYVRFVIAKHSPERVLETGLRMEALEKNAATGVSAAQTPYSLVRFVGKIPRKVGLFRSFQEQSSRV